MTMEARAIAGTLMGSALLVGALLWYGRWQRTGDALSLVASSFAIGLAGLARYELFIVGWALAVLTLVGPRSRPEDARDERPAFATAYAAAVTGVLGLWLVTALVTTGEILGFVGPTQPLVAPARRVAVEALLVMVPVLALALVAAASRRGTAVAVAAGTIAAWAAVAAIAGDSWLALDAVIPLIPLGALLASELLTYAVRRKGIA